MTIAAPRAITLDLDDTLWPVGPVLAEAERVLADWLQAHAPRTAAATTADSRAEVRRRVLADHPARAHDLGFVRHEALRRSLRASGDDPTLADDAFAVFLQARQRVSPYDDAAVVLERWAARVPLVAVSNGNADVMGTALGRFFVGAVSAHVVGCAKPDPRIFLEACRIAGTAPDAVLHIGDDPLLDVAGAQRAGLRAAWLHRADFTHRHAEVRHLTPYADLHALDAAVFG